MKLDILLKYIITNTTSYLINNSCINNFNIYNYDTQNEINTYENIVILANISRNVYYKNTNYKNISNDTVRAYVFSNEDDSINIVAFKGTSLHLSHGNDMIGHNDKLNDNTFFSCCYYKEVKNLECDLTNKYKKHEKKYDDTKEYICNKECYKKSLENQYNYYNISKNIVDTWIKTIKSDATVIFTGHSLGGTLATMVGITFDKHVITFESPGEKHYIDLIDLKYNKTNIDKIYHYGHNADIIFTGKCNGKSSLCNLGGYIIKTKCHIGNVCEYDAINKLNIKESIFTHKIEYVIDNIITKWNNTLPECSINDNCIDCNEWNYIN